MKSRRVTVVGWVGLGLSVLWVALTVATPWLFFRDLSCGEGHEMSSVAFLWPWSLLASFCDFLAAIAINTLAGTRGFGNRLAGIFGGVVMLSPLLIVPMLLTAGMFG